MERIILLNLFMTTLNQLYLTAECIHDYSKLMIYLRLIFSIITLNQ